MQLLSERMTLMLQSLSPCHQEGDNRFQEKHAEDRALPQQRGPGEHPLR